MTPATYMMQNTPQGERYPFTNISMLLTVCRHIGAQLKLAPFVPLPSWSLCGKSQTWPRSANEAAKRDLDGEAAFLVLVEALFPPPPWSRFLAECLGD